MRGTVDCVRMCPTLGVIITGGGDIHAMEGKSIWEDDLLSRTHLQECHLWRYLELFRPSLSANIITNVTTA